MQALHSLDSATANISLTTDLMNNLIMGVFSFHKEKYEASQKLSQEEKNLAIALMQRTDDRCKKTLLDMIICANDFDGLSDYFIDQNREMMIELKDFALNRW